MASGLSAKAAPELYFAYGSNMDPAQMRVRCPSSQSVEVGCLSNYRLAFPRKSRRRQCGVASVQRCHGEEVWGVIYRLSAEDLLHLDEFEDYNGPNHTDNGYERITHDVHGRSGKIYKGVHIYIGVPEDGEPPLPSVDYMKQIITGATFWNLPEIYIERLKEHKSR